MVLKASHLAQSHQAHFIPEPECTHARSLNLGMSSRKHPQCIVSTLLGRIYINYTLFQPESLVGALDRSLPDFKRNIKGCMPGSTGEAGRGAQQHSHAFTYTLCARGPSVHERKPARIPGRHVTDIAPGDSPFHIQNITAGILLSTST